MLDPSHSISELKGRLTDQYLQKWTEELCNVSKMRTYRSYKSELVMESYLLLPLHLRTALLRFRISCHQLRIEIGRYLRLHRKEFVYFAMMGPLRMKNIVC